jgi:hypothetical protein
MGPLFDSLPVVVSVRHAEQRPPQRRARRPGLLARVVARARSEREPVQSVQPAQAVQAVQSGAEPARSASRTRVVPTA